jgi:hypothetical protein
MNAIKQAGQAALSGRPGFLFTPWFLLALGVTNTAPAQTVDATQHAAPIDETLSEAMQGHGSVSIGYENILVNGFLPDIGPPKEIGTVRSRRVDLDVEYYVANNWSITAGVPYISNRYEGARPHCPTNTPPQCVADKIAVLSPPHPESQFLDDGDYHGTWQDWNLGVAYHTNIDTYYITPSITAYIPSHHYTFFAQAAVGQDLQQVELAVNLAHQFDFSNFYYQVGYGYVFSQETLGYNVNYSKFDLELGYYVSPQLTLRVSSLGKLGNGVQFSQFTNSLTDYQTNNIWYHHDQITAHEYVGVGGGLDYLFNEKYTFSTTLQTLVWGSSVFNFRYTLETTLRRAF